MTTVYAVMVHTGNTLTPVYLAVSRIDAELFIERDLCQLLEAQGMDLSRVDLFSVQRWPVGRPLVRDADQSTLSTFSRYGNPERVVVPYGEEEGCVKTPYSYLLDRMKYDDV